ncbi:hypothetical protein AAFC00_004281 [Neodothiora populina]|uniref:BZIP domain-containing protein n=1 Tax=Neodothiora populina TaxID=2781224 RepID=A0ABR3PJ59_9PEZI
MAGQTSPDDQFNPYLSSTQQDLLMAALTSNDYSNKHNAAKSDNINNNPQIKRSNSDPRREKAFVAPSYMDSLNSFDASNDNTVDASSFANFDFDDTSPYLDYLDGDTSLNFDSNDLGGEDMFGSVPAPQTDSSESDKGDRSDKRKSPDEADDDDDDGDAKRREGDDKSAKKPGRKPLTSEPTTKRKAQNRAAQRAFRERKEKHLKDLETKVESLSKASEADRQENGVLRAQVERLQAELREYKKRMSMTSTGVSQSPPSVSRFDSRSNSKPGSDFQFDFPAFGNLPGSHLFDAQTKRDNVSSAAGAVSQNNQPARQASQGKYQSPRTSAAQQQNSSISQIPPSNHSSRHGSMNGQKSVSPVDGFNSTLPQMTSSLFTPSIMNDSSNDYGFSKKVTASPQHMDHGGDSNSGISRAFRFNSGSASSNNASPSVSSLSQFNPNSSCGTSPESSHESPPADVGKPKDNLDTYSFNSNPTNSNTFANLNSGNTNPSTDFNFDWLANQNGGQFDPVLFGDYRDSQEAVIGDGDFNNGFFNDAFPYDIGSPLNFDLNSPKVQTQQPMSASKSLLAEVEKARDGGDDDMLLPTDPSYIQQVQQVSQKEKVPYETAEKMLNCKTIWTQLQQNPDFQDGKFDLDSLCAELRAKAKCSESGVTVPSTYVDAAFKKLSNGAQEAKQQGKAFPQFTGGDDYLFQRNSVDEALRKLGSGL